jgi:hypothetical protein
MTALKIKGLVVMCGWLLVVLAMYCFRQSIDGFARTGWVGVGLVLSGSASGLALMVAGIRWPELAIDEGKREEVVSES